MSASCSLANYWFSPACLASARCWYLHNWAAGRRTAGRNTAPLHSTATTLSTLLSPPLQWLVLSPLLLVLSPLLLVSGDQASSAVWGRVCAVVGGGGQVECVQLGGGAVRRNKPRRGPELAAAPPAQRSGHCTRLSPQSPLLSQQQLVEHGREQVLCCELQRAGRALLLQPTLLSQYL